MNQGPQSTFGRRGRVGILLSLLLASCGQADQGFLRNDDFKKTAANACDTVLDCNNGEQCINKVCQASLYPAGQLFFEVETDSRSQYVTSHFFADPNHLDNSSIEIQLSRPVQFDYRVLDSTGLPIRASITVIGTNRIPSHERVHGEDYFPDQKVQLKLLPGEYRIRIVPKDESLPGVDSEFTVKETTTAKDFSLPSSYRQITGRVHQRSDSSVALSGVIVHAYSLSSGLLSSTALTASDGSYKISLPHSDDTSFRVLAEVTCTDPNQATWRFEQDVRVELSEDRIFDIGFNPSVHEQQGQVKIRILGAGENGPEPIVGASVTLTASAAFATQIFVLKGETDSDGVLAVFDENGPKTPAIVAASYQIEIIPLNGSPYARSKLTLDFNQLNPRTDADKHIEIPKRLFVSGAVASSEGALLANANVEFNYQRKGTEQLSPGARIDTGADGSFAVWLDPGDYLVQVNPPQRRSAQAEPGSKPQAFYLLTIPDDQIAHMLAPFYLSQGSLIQGQVLGFAREIISNASVEPFIQIEGVEQPVSLGVHTLDQFGRFEAIVPSK